MIGVAAPIPTVRAHPWTSVFIAFKPCGP